MKKINWKIFNTALWGEIVLAYILPFRNVDNFKYQVGFPITFISVYDSSIGINPLMSMHFNPLALFINVVILYLIISVVIKVYHKFKHD